MSNTTLIRSNSSAFTSFKNFSEESVDTEDKNNIHLINLFILFNRFNRPEKQLFRIFAKCSICLHYLAQQNNKQLLFKNLYYEYNINVLSKIIKTYQ